LPRNSIEVHLPLQTQASVQPSVPPFALGSRLLAYNAPDLPVDRNGEIDPAVYFLEYARSITKDVAKGVAKLGKYVLQEAYFYANGSPVMAGVSHSSVSLQCPITIIICFCLENKLCSFVSRFSLSPFVSHTVICKPNGGD
jgi:hypothetical protein